MATGGIGGLLELSLASAGVFVALACAPAGDPPPVSSAAEAGPVAEDSAPNIVFIMADDLGWGDLSSYGRADYSTPRIDQLAAQGVRFTDAYAIAPLCTPTRIGFMTGRYPGRNPFHRHLPEHRELGLAPDPNLPSVPARLAASGYDTALIGKWNLGERTGFMPGDHGFGYFFGSLLGGTDYASHVNSSGEPDLFRDDQPVSASGYFTDVLTDEAVAYIERARPPFFLSLQYTAPHWPYQKRGDPPLPPGANLFEGGSMEKYAAMVTAMDEGVGRVVDALEARDLRASTLLVFTSDNGGEQFLPMAVDFSDMGGLRGHKRQLFEGGVRVPAIVRWPGKIAPGGVTGQVATTLDFAATILAAAGVSTAPDVLDGIDLLPVLRNETAETERTVFWRTRRQRAVRSGRLKYVASREGKDQAAWRELLFDLVEDPGERHDLAASRPETVEALRGKWAGWNARMLPRS